MEKEQISSPGAEGVCWDLRDLYASIDDPQIEKDLQKTLQRAKAFEKTYRSKIKSATLTAKTLLKAVKDLEALNERCGKILAYATLVFSADTQEPRHGAFIQSMQERVTEIRKHLIFFDLEWVSQPDSRARKLLGDKSLSRYRHLLENERRYKPHLLSEPEEKILDEKSNTGISAFERLFGELTSAIRFPFEREQEKKDLSEQEVLALLHDGNRSVRRAAADALTKGLKSSGRIINFIFNVVVADHAIDDRLRSYGDPMSSRHLSNEIEPKSVEALLSSCEADTDIVNRYYLLKKRILGYDTLYDYDRYAPLFSNGRTIPFSECKETVLSAFEEFSPKMREIASIFFEKKWIDAELRPGKRGGAFSHGTVPSAHPYILVNYTGKPRDVMTVAHELGHGVHQFLSRPQGYLQSHTPLTTAETASVFGEMLVFQRLKAQETDPKRRLALLCEKLEDTFATVFRQVVMTRFEQSLHHARRREGELPEAKINALWLAANRPMFGEAVVLREDYGWWWMYISHFIQSPFYCYAYAFGELLVFALYQRYLVEGGAFTTKYLELLSAGGSDSPERLLDKVGVDIADPHFWSRGLDLLSSWTDEAEQLAKEAGY